MNTEEKIQAHNRELQHRLREVHTENAELKIQYRRWMILSAVVSLCSLGLSIYIVVSSPPQLNMGAPVAISQPAPLPMAKPAPTPTQATAPVPVPVRKPITVPPPPAFDDMELEDPLQNASPLDLEPEPASISRPKPADTPFTLPKAAADHKIHVVQEYDNLSSIAKRYYGSTNPRYVDKIKRDNNLSSDALHIGMKLKILPK